MGRNVEEEAWVICRTNAQLKFLTSWQRELGFEGPTRAPGLLVKGSALPGRLPEHRATLTMTLADTAWPVTGRCSDLKRQTLAPLCGKEGEEMPFTCTLEEGMESQG